MPHDRAHRELKGSLLGNIHNCVDLGDKVFDITKSEFSHLYLGIGHTYLPTFLTGLL